MAELVLVRGAVRVTDAEKVGRDLSQHEAVCAERWSAANARLKRVEGVLIGAAGVIIMLLLNIAVKINGG